jgi:hypothetical protein
LPKGNAGAGGKTKKMDVTGNGYIHLFKKENKGQ